MSAKLDNRETETEGEAKTSPRTPVVGRLDTLPRIRREAARLYSDARRGLIATSDASRLASVLTLLAALVRDGELAQIAARVEALELRK
jgi:hypothetical protein